MESRILLLLVLTSSVWAGTFEMNQTQSLYEAVENQTITLEWTFTIRRLPRHYEIFCQHITDDRISVVLYVEQGVQCPDSQHPDFTGRVQFDEEVFREGRLRVHVSRLQTTDSGLYRCEVETEYGSSVGKSQLSVSDSSAVFGDEPVQASAGDDVILSCHIDPPVSVTDLTVEWTWKDVVVHVYRHRKDDEDSQDEHFRNRTSMFHHELIRGNISLKLTNVTEEDSGLYFCYVPGLNSQVKRGKVNLTVSDDEEPQDDKKQSRDQTVVIVTSVFSVPLLIIAVSAAIMFYKRRKTEKKKKQENDRHGDQPATEGTKDQNIS